MKFQTGRDIAASPQAIWDILTDARALQHGDTGIIAIEGEIVEGGRITLESEAAPGRRFRLTVSRVQAPQHMVWTGGMPLGLFTGRRVFTLTPIDTGTRLEVVETYSGPLVPLMARVLPDLTPSFEHFARGVAALAEELT